MKRLLWLVLFISFFAASGCAQNSASVARKEAGRKDSVQAETKETVPAKPKPVITAKDLKLQTQSSPKAKYNDLSLGQARREQSEAQRGQRNAARNNQSGAYSHRYPL